MKNKSNIKKVVALTTVLFSIFIFSNTLKSQITCPNYVIQNLLGCDIRVAYEVMDGSCNTTCLQTLFVIPAGNSYTVPNSPCCTSGTAMDIFVDVVDVWDSGASTWVPIGLPQSMNGFCTTCTGCPFSASWTGSNSSPCNNITITWASNKVQIQ